MSATVAGMAGEVGYALRIPPDLKEWLEARAKENRRSLNSEMIFRLQQSKETEERSKS